MIWYIQLTNKNDKDDENKNTKLIEKGRQIAKFNNAMLKAISSKDNQGINGYIIKIIYNWGLGPIPNLQTSIIFPINLLLN